jgi:hypothetical protein
MAMTLRGLFLERWSMTEELWASQASNQFIEAASTLLQSYLHQHQQPSWTDFVDAILAHFCRNQHQILVRCLIHISQTTIVEDYVARFSALMDQITTYESCPNPLHYTTKFLDGLKPGVLLLVAIDIPQV